MKKIAALLLCISVFTFNSCDDEILDPALLTEATSCDFAVSNTAQAASNLSGANVDNYTQLCTAYKNALQAQIAICGDEDGSLQDEFDSLGDCAGASATDCDSATNAVSTAQMAFENASADDYTNLCNVYRATLENQITQCGDEDGSIQATIDGLGNCISQANLLLGFWKLIAFTEDGVPEDLTTDCPYLLTNLFEGSDITEINYSDADCSATQTNEGTYTFENGIITVDIGDGSFITRTVQTLNATTLIYEQITDDVSYISTFERIE